MRRALLLLLGLLPALMSSVRAEDGADTVERQRLQVTRGEVEARYQGRVRECEQRFFVTDCLERARKERREALAPIDARIATLDEAERSRRAQERLERIGTGKAERAVRAGEAASMPASPRQPKPAPTASGKLPRQPAPPPTAASAAERAAQEQKARERHQRKQEEAAAHRAEVERRNAGDKPPAAPLPPASKP
ncbi:hypothetical protein [Rivibacter subsaxonicus]|uniref:Uncharacterized protein n=1 Tax=Rivibacter subsaxonicus TaxID=457575 RepID=A0A4Q7VAY6_9BURK|nr:hypothetical protein [Rivibacter subsaxonicus]RZT92503.1 hypothetical protein EV670_3477 [Rivibacter subsaxonicus]